MILQNLFERSFWAAAVSEMNSGLVDAALGGYVYGVFNPSAQY